MSEYEPKVGDHVRIIQDAPPDVPRATLWTVKVVNDQVESPGKVVGLECPERWEVLHSLNGAVEHMTGWWSLPENLERIQL